MGGKLTQAPATPELVEKLRSRKEYLLGGPRRLMNLCEQAADALEAQQARIAELEVENERLRLTMLGGEDVAGFASSLPLAQVLDSFRTYETALLDSANSAQALADRYEKTLDLALDVAIGQERRLIKYGKPANELAWLIEQIRQALSSQWRREGGEDGLPESPGVNAIETRPIPGYPEYYARSDGLVERDGVVLRPIIQYPRVRLRSNDRRVAVPLHTLVALAFHGERPPGAEIDHLDDDPMNSRPHNLAYKTRAENQSRRRHASHNTQKTHCPHGHAYDADNTYLSSDNRRICRACKRKATLPASPDGPSQIDRVWAAINVLGAPDTACTSDEDRAYCRAIGDALLEIEKIGGRPQ